MVVIITLILFFSSNNIIFPQEIDWTIQFGAEGSGIKTFANSIVLDSSGNIYVCGDTEASLPGQTSQGGRDCFIKKYTNNGTEIWTRQFGGTMDDSAVNIAIDQSNNIYVAGYYQTGLTTSEAYIKKFDTSGTLLWTKNFGVQSTLADGIVVFSGNIYVSGEIYGNFPGQTSSGKIDAFIRKCDINGNEIWTRQFGTSESEYAPHLAVDISGNIYVCGYTEGVFQSQTGSGGIDAYLKKYDANGNELWIRQFGTVGSDGCEAIYITVEGNIIVCGNTGGTLPGETSSGGMDAFLRCYLPSGNINWTKQFGTNTDDFLYHITADLAGNIYVCGCTSGTFSGQTNYGMLDAFVRKYDTNINHLWTKQFGTNERDYIYNIAIDTSGKLYNCGLTYGTFPGQTQVGWGNAFITRMRQQTYRMQGYVRDNLSMPIQDVNMFLTGSIQRSTSTDSNGFFRFDALPVGGNYTVTPSKISYVFTPVNISTAAIFSNMDNCNFTGTYSSATYSISGTVKNSQNQGISGTTVTISGDAFETLITQTDGIWVFSNLSAGGNFTITPTHIDYLFTPEFINIPSLYSNLTDQNFSGSKKPVLVLNKTSLDFGYLKKGEKKTMSFIITNDGEVTLTGTITPNKTWIKVDKTSFSGKYNTVNVTVDNKEFGVTAGEYSGKISIVSNGGNNEVNVKFTATCVLAFPNPFYPEKQKLNFYGSGIVPEKTIIKIWTVSGELLKVLKDPFIWDGRIDSSNEPVVSGIYIYTYESPKEKGTGKFTVIK